MGDGGFGIIWDQDFSNPSKELKGVDMGTNPARQVLRETGLREGMIARTQGSHKEIGLLGLSCEGILNRDSLTGIIDK